MYEMMHSTTKMDEFIDGEMKKLKADGSYEWVPPSPK